MKAIKNTFKEFSRYPSAIFGMVIIALLIVVSIYAVISLPYKQAITLWRAGEGIWYQNPKFAQPAWTNFFRKNKLPETIDQSTLNGTAPKTIIPGDTINEELITTPSIIPTMIILKTLPSTSPLSTLQNSLLSPLPGTLPMEERLTWEVSQLKLPKRTTSARIPSSNKNYLGYSHNKLCLLPILKRD
jgi:hypothetical protein